MVEKRKLPARDRRESAAKRRASEATPQPPASSKKKASTPITLPPPTPEPVPEPLPTKIKDGEGLPTVSKAQELSKLSAREYQSIAERYESGC